MFTSCPPNRAVTKAAIGLMIAKGIPSNDAVAKIESTPVCGVAIKNEVVAPFDAPSLRNDIAVGMTPHEHNGKGTPIIAAQKTERKSFFDR